MSDILLIIPPFNYIKVEEAGPKCPHLGVAYIAAVLEKAKYDVKILDCYALDLTQKEALEAIKKNNPKVIGISAVTSEFPFALELCKAIKKYNKKIPIILGGPHATIMPDTCENENIDYIVLGEGEDTALELFNFIINKKGDIRKINGIGYMKNGKMNINPMRQLIQDLDSLPFPAYHLLPMNKFRPYAIYETKRKFTSMITSRGCPFRCTYCTSSAVFGHKWRKMSPQRMIELVNHLNEKYKISHIYFQDDEFTIDHKRTDEFCNLMIQNNKDIIWECLSRVDHIDEKLLKKMYKAGCRGVVYGIEVGYPEGLKLIKKGITLQQAENAIKWTKKNKIHARASFMMGFPWESAKEIKKTIKFAKKLDADITYFQVFTPYPGTELYEQMKNEGLILRNDWKDYVQHAIVGNDPVIKTRYLSNSQLKYWNSRAFIELYLQPHVIIKKILELRNYSQLRRQFIVFTSIMKNAIKRIITEKK